MRSFNEGPLPPFATPAGKKFQQVNLSPPFPFQGTIIRAFPLRSNIDVLERFCNNYLNIVPPEVGRFRPFMPFVYFLFVDYGRMAVEAENLGWFATREFVFNVPVEWYKRVRGEWVFHDYAIVSPFIFVDGQMSMNVGRSVFGWPKTIGRMTPKEADWISNPLVPLTGVRLRTTVFEELFEGRKLDDKVFMEIDHESPAGTFQFPMDAAGLVNPWTIAYRSARSLTALATDVTCWLEGLGMAPMHWGSDASNYLAQMGRLGEWAYPLGRDSVTNTLNLKQFRLTNDPERYCFQALTNGPMRFTALNGAGICGQKHVMLGDSSGGYTLKLHRWPNLPIMETLGLKAERTYRGPGVDVSELKPVFPFWLDGNMEYLGGYDVARRGEDGVWEDGAGRRFHPVTGPDRKVARRDTLFNTTLGAYNAPVVGPFQYVGTTIRVLPLLADRRRLAELLDEYLNEPLQGSGFRFEVWYAKEWDKNNKEKVPPAPRMGDLPPTAYVYMTATAWGDVLSLGNNVGDWANGEVSFFIPVRQYNAKDELCGVGLVPAAIFTDNPTAAASRTEVLGLPATLAKFSAPNSRWMDEGADDLHPAEDLLRVGAQILPVLGEGQEARSQTILEVSRAGRRRRDNPEDPTVEAHLKAEEERKKRLEKKSSNELDIARLLANALIEIGRPFVHYSLKQIRDAREPAKAAYQSLVAIPRTLRGRRPGQRAHFEELEKCFHLYIYESPTFPLAATLGLIGCRDITKGPKNVLRFTAVKPFFCRANLKEGVGTTLTTRHRNGQWKVQNDGTDTGLQAPDAFDLSTTVIKALSAGDPRDPAKYFMMWLKERDKNNSAGVGSGGKGPAGVISRSDAQRALETVDLQMIIEAELANETGSEARRWKAWRDEISRQLDVRTVEFHRDILGTDPHKAIDSLESWIKNQFVGKTRLCNGLETTPEELARQFVELLHIQALMEVSTTFIVLTSGQAQAPTEGILEVYGNVVNLIGRFMSLKPIGAYFHSQGYSAHVKKIGELQQAIGTPEAGGLNLDAIRKSSVDQFSQLNISTLRTESFSLSTNLSQIKQSTQEDEDRLRKVAEAADLLTNHIKLQREILLDALGHCGQEETASTPDCFRRNRNEDFPERDPVEPE